MTARRAPPHPRRGHGRAAAPPDPARPRTPRAPPRPELAPQPLHRSPNARRHADRIELAPPESFDQLFLRERDVELAPRHESVAGPVEEKAARHGAVAS